MDKEIGIAGRGPPAGGRGACPGTQGRHKPKISGLGCPSPRLSSDLPLPVFSFPRISPLFPFLLWGGFSPGAASLFMVCLGVVGVA